MKKLLPYIFAGIALISLGFAQQAIGAVLQGFQGGTGISTSTSASQNYYLQVASTTPFLTYTLSPVTGVSGSVTINKISTSTYTFSCTTSGSVTTSTDGTGQGIISIGCGGASSTVVVAGFGTTVTASGTTYTVNVNSSTILTVSSGTALYYPLSLNPSGYLTNATVTAISPIIWTTTSSILCPTCATHTNALTTNYFTLGGGGGNIQGVGDLNEGSNGQVNYDSTAVIDGFNGTAGNILSGVSTTQAIIGGPLTVNGTSTFPTLAPSSFAYINASHQLTTTSTPSGGSSSGTVGTTTLWAAGDIAIASTTTNLLTSYAGTSCATGMAFTGLSASGTPTCSTFATSTTGSASTLLEEDAAGTVNGSNVTFTTNHTPVFMAVGGQTMINGDGFTLSGLTETFTNAPLQTPHSFYTAGAGSGAAPSNVMILLASSTLTSASSAIAVSGIGSTVSSSLLVVDIQVPSTLGAQFVMRFNNDAGNHYDSRYTDDGTGGTLVNASGTSNANIQGQATFGVYNLFNGTVSSTRTGNFQLSDGNALGTAPDYGNGSFNWASSTPITSISFVMNAGNFPGSTTLSVWGSQY